MPADDAAGGERDPRICGDGDDPLLPLADSGLVPPLRPRFGRPLVCTLSLSLSLSRKKFESFWLKFAQFLAKGLNLFGLNLGSFSYN